MPLKMKPIQLDETAQDPLYRQLYQQLRRQILAGELLPGEKLPSSRRLAKKVGVGRITAIQAYRQLEEEGFITSRSGAGTFVANSLPPPDAATARFTPTLSAWGRRVSAAANRPRRERQRPQIDFGFGRSFSQLFPYDVWRRLLARYLSTDDVMLSRYGSPAGFTPLRQALASYLQHQRGVNCTAEQLIIVSGAQQALDILARLLFSPGDEVVVETPGYNDAYRLFRTHGVTLLPRVVDEEGLPTEGLPSGAGIKAAFVTPAHQFPRGGTLPLARRLQLLQWAREQGALIIEDDYDSELRYEVASTQRPTGAGQEWPRRLPGHLFEGAISGAASRLRRAAAASGHPLYQGAGAR